MINKVRFPAEITKEYFLEKAAEMYSHSKFTYEINKNSLLAMEDIVITCKLHGNFTRKVNHHLSGASCVQCSNATRGKKSERKFIAQDFI